jgi:hypothetical protein
MLPTLKIPREDLISNGMINAFIEDSVANLEYEDAIYLLFKPKDLDRFRVFIESEHERTKSLIDDYDLENGYVVLVYKLDLKFREDFNIVKTGRYSKTSPAFQKLFPKTVEIIINGLRKDELSLQYRIFNKTDDLVKFWEDLFGMSFSKDQEIWHGWKQEAETLNTNKIKEYV